MPFSHVLQLMAALPPDGAVAVACVGMLLIFLEFNRPGRILPASLGLLLLLLSSATLVRLGLQPWAVGALVAAMAGTAGNLYWRLSPWLLLLLTAGWVVGLRFLIRPRGPTFVHTSVALLCGGVLGIVSAVLTRIACRARCAKALN